MRSHRGLSAVVGTVFLIAVVIGALSYVSYSLDVMGNFSESLIVEESRQRDKQSESFAIESIDVTDTSKLDGVIKNTGEIPLELTTLWIDEQGVNDVVQKFTISEEIAPGKSVDISSLVDFTMDADKGYNMKVVSSRGEVNSFYVNSLSNENVYMKLTATPRVIPSTFTSTLLFTVVNNMSNGNYLYNLTPVMNDTKQTLDPTSAGLEYSMIGTGPTPSSYDSLGPGEVAVFTYDIMLTGDTDNDMQLFNVTLANANPGNEALASVSIQSVPLAKESGSSLTSLGLDDTVPDFADVLFFHQSTNLSPNGEYHMDGSSPNSGGFTQSPNGNTLEFISADVKEITTIPIGEFTATLNYYSSIVPLTFPDPDLAFFFDCRDCGDENTIANSMDTLDENERGLRESDNPVFSGDSGGEPNGDGPDGDEYYHLNDASEDSYFWSEWDGDDGDNEPHTQVGNYPDTTAFWIRIDPTSDTNVPLVVAHEWEWGHDDYYGFWLIDGRDISYGWETAHSHHGSYPDTRNCDSPAGDGISYDDNEWHHIVGVRDAAYGCKLYIDGKLMANANSGSGDGYVQNEYWVIGHDIYNGVDFDGDIASLIHWNSDALSPEQVEDLYYTNYGNNGTRLHYKIEVTDIDGVPLVGVDPVIPLTKIELPFKDPVLGNHDDQGSRWINVDTSNGTDAKFYGDADDDNDVLFHANMTTLSTEVITLQVGERLKLTLDWNGFDEANLPINISMDDNNCCSTPDGPTYLQTPPPDPAWPTFLTFDYDEQIVFNAYNEGPEGVWFTFSGTRLVLTSNDGTTSYAGLGHYVNYTTANTPKDD